MQPALPPQPTLLLTYAVICIYIVLCLLGSLRVLRNGLADNPKKDESSFKSSEWVGREYTTWPLLERGTGVSTGGDTRHTEVTDFRSEMAVCRSVTSSENLQSKPGPRKDRLT
ncbi:hypothetical protein AV530_017005 [Patagioenas fasciata monilis]|uniref:Uncharacterized protein n=1 Tax=Patagioenas fasciata monilis TaxID=372326 RepID=A0A1V4J4M5_PATFA|nr:hypothetical protein AV530_017005 [Patagioenas fasciata monilis]